MKNRKMVLMASALLVCAVLFFGVMNVNATWTVGVKVGDWADYSVVMSNADVYMLKVNVTKIEPTTIYYNLSCNPPVFTGEYESDSMNISSGRGYYASGTVTYEFSFPFFIGANRNAGDQLYSELVIFPFLSPLSLYTIIIYETTYREYNGQNIEVNHAYVTFNSTDYSFYWIRATGMLAELKTPQEEVLLTSASVIPEFPTPLLLLALVSATIPAIIIVLHRRKQT